MNMGNLVQSGSIKYLENDLLKEVVQTIRSTVHDQNGVCQTESEFESEPQNDAEPNHQREQRMSIIDNLIDDKPVEFPRSSSE